MNGTLHTRPPGLRRLADSVWQLRLPASERLVLLGLLHLQHAEPERDPSIGRIALATGLSEATVRRATQALAVAHLLDIQVRDGLSKRYIIKVSRPVVTAALDIAGPFAAVSAAAVAASKALGSSS